ncbi:cupin domain-containing protein [Nocardiopsis halotolerans]|uniref:cupin domain-containing protein n=1 Tax=Nocardiopsis halotolerans TaxID=124252 RepID=UPI0003456557|nr:cupin domain-containing protein [Nocardiopsis halotolerans]
MNAFGNLHRDLLGEKPHDHGGAGTVLAHRFHAAPPTAGAVTHIDVAVLPPGVSIGRHRHGSDRETYVVLRGGGVMHVDGADVRVGRGDVVVNRPFGEHGLVNDGTEDLEILVFEVAVAEEHTERT